MAIALRNATEANVPTGNITVNVPAAVADNDVLYLVIKHQISGTTPTITTPAGWTLVDNPGVFTVGTCILSRVLCKTFRRVAASEPASYTVTVGGIGDQGADAIMAAYSGMDTTTPEDGVTPTHTTDSAGTGTPQSPAITSATDNAWILSIACSASGFLNGTPSNMTLDKEQVGLVLGVAHANKTPAGSFTPATFGTATDSYSATSIVLRPSGGAAAAPFAVTNWPLPNPKKFASDLRGYSDGSEFWLLAGKDVQFGGAGQWKTYDYPNPTLKKDDANRRWFGGSYKWQLLNLDAQFGGPGQWKTYDWPNPISVWNHLKKDHVWTRAFTNSYDLALIGQDTVYGARGQTATFDWPNPVRVADAGRLRGFVDSFKQALIGADFLPFALRDWPNPLRADRYARGFLDWFKLQLVGKDFLPFSLGDWPLPTPARPNLELRTHLWNPLVTLLNVVTQAPFQMWDWTIPRGYVFATALRTWLDQYKQALIAQDFLPFSLSDWPNPTLTEDDKRRGWLDWFRLQLIGQDFLPFSLSDWPNPLRYQPLNNLRTFVDWFKSQLIGKDTLPFALGDWPNPLRADRYARGFLDWFKQQLVGQDFLPFSLSDWPNPLTYSPLNNLRTWLVNLVNTTLLPIPFPFSLSDWPNPLRADKYARGFLDWFKLQLIGKDFLPFSLSDWPLPTLRRDDVNRRTFLDWFKLQLINQDSLPFRLLDWPLPVLARFNLELRTHVWNPLYQLLTIFVQSPFNLTDWPNPLRYVPAISLRTWLGDLVRPLAGQDVLPFALSDWPNPLRIVDDKRLRGFFDWFKLQLVAQDVLPFNLTEWPNPLRYQPLTNLRTWIISLVSSMLVSQDFLPFRLRDWPNPLRYVPATELRTWISGTFSSTVVYITVRGWALIQNIAATFSVIFDAVLPFSRTADATAFSAVGLDSGLAYTRGGDSTGTYAIISDSV